MKFDDRPAVPEVIAFDADDTLWHNEIHYARAQQRLQALLVPYWGDDGLVDELYHTEMANLAMFGYGLKSFGLSMIETAIRVTQGRIQAGDVAQILELVKEMKRAPVELLEHVAEVIPTLASSHTLMVITKGDLLDQEDKMERSGLAPYFYHVEVVSAKTEEVYRTLLRKHQISPQRFLMVGNSLRSDVLPVVGLGGHAVHIPYAITWQHEHASVTPQELAQSYTHLEHVGLLPGHVERIAALYLG